MDDALAALSSLDEPVRRRLYEHVAGAERPVSRDEAAAAAGIGRSLAAYHLDKLADQGFLAVCYERRSGRSGPGAGRPAKLYARSGREFAASVPARDYELVAELLAEAAESSPRLRTAACERAREEGKKVAADAATGRKAGGRKAAEAAPGGREAADAAPGRKAGAPLALEALLRARGYAPFQAADGALRLRNCPFHRVAQRHRDVVCAMNLALVDGMLDGLGAEGCRAELDPVPGECCVAIRREPE